MTEEIFAVVAHEMFERIGAKVVAKYEMGEELPEWLEEIVKGYSA